MNEKREAREERQPIPPLSVPTILMEGFITGIIGAGLVAAWFLLLDTIQNVPLWTPSLLGTVLFKGTEAAVAHQQVDPGMVAAYTLVHHAAFIGVGLVASFLVSEIERIPPLGIALVFLFVFFETAFQIFLLAVGGPLLGGIAFWGVALANLLAAAGMAAYLWYRHPRILFHFNRIWHEE
ncbi:MAG TPA: hypothetical protein VMR66_01830 [Gemmatimonadota bacterium]|nr:hypothetical protein [Gemmatimonadota bacterium]